MGYEVKGFQKLILTSCVEYFESRCIKHTKTIQICEPLNSSKNLIQGPPYIFVTFPRFCWPITLQSFKLMSFMVPQWKLLNPLNRISDATELGYIFKV